MPRCRPELRMKATVVHMFKIKFLVPKLRTKGLVMQQSLNEVVVGGEWWVATTLCAHGTRCKLTYPKSLHPWAALKAYRPALKWRPARQWPLVTAAEAWLLHNNQAISDRNAEVKRVSLRRGQGLPVSCDLFAFAAAQANGAHPL